MKCKRCNGSGQEPDHRALGEVLRMQRKKLRVSLNDVAESMGFKPQYLCDLEHGRRSWNADLIAAYKKALK